jgi:hypothetical protein
MWRRSFITARSLAMKMATNVYVMLSNRVSSSGYSSDLCPLACSDRHFICYEQLGLQTAPAMSLLRHFDNGRRKSWCAVVVLAAVCSLIVSVATRYSSSWDVSAPAVKTLRGHTTPEAKRQRLDKDAADWVPPLVGFDVLRSPSSYPRTAPAQTPAQNRFLEESLFNRPPPSSEFLL